MVGGVQLRLEQAEPKDDDDDESFNGSLEYEMFACVGNCILPSYSSKKIIVAVTSIITIIVITSIIIMNYHYHYRQYHHYYCKKSLCFSKASLY